MNVILTTLCIVLIAGTADGKRSIWWKKKAAGGGGSSSSGGYSTTFQNQVLDCLSEIKTTVNELEKDMETVNRKIDRLLKGSSDFISFENHTYTIIKEESTWEEAEQHCENLGNGATLININTVDEWNFLMSELSVDTNTYWIGMKDSVTENVWKWMDGTTLERDVADVAWFQGWPNENDFNLQPNGASAQNCGQIRSLYNRLDGTWHSAGANYINDYYCSTNNPSYSICEIPVPVEYLYDY